MSFMYANHASSFGRTLVRGFSYAGYQLRRRDRAADIFPTDRASGAVEGPNPYRVVVIGEATAMGYGVLTHELGLACQFARQLASRTGRGSLWSANAMPDNLIRNAPELVAELDGELSAAEIVIVLGGIADTLSLTTCASWRRQLSATLDGILESRPPGALVLVPEIPPLSRAGAIPAVIRRASSHQAHLLNQVTAEVVASRPGCQVVSFPLHLDNQLWRAETRPPAYRAMYAAWAAAILEVALGPTAVSAH